MTLRELEKRIKRLNPGPLLLLCKMPDGSEKAMTVQEMIETGSHFQRVARGNNLRDLDRMLQYEFEHIMRS